MSTQKTMDKSIMDMVHDSAKDLHAAGVMKETTLREFDALCGQASHKQNTASLAISGTTWAHVC